MAVGGQQVGSQGRWNVLCPASVSTPRSNTCSATTILQDVYHWGKLGKGTWHLCYC